MGRNALRRPRKAKSAEKLLSEIYDFAQRSGGRVSWIRLERLSRVTTGKSLKALRP